MLRHTEHKVELLEMHSFNMFITPFCVTFLMEHKLFKYVLPTPKQANTHGMTTYRGDREVCLSMATTKNIEKCEENMVK